MSKKTKVVVDHYKFHWKADFKKNIIVSPNLTREQGVAQKRGRFGKMNL